MKKQAIVLGAFLAFMGFNSAQAQINLGQNTLGAISTGLTALTFSDADAAALAQAAVHKLDSASTVLPATDGYTIRLNRIFAPHASLNGMPLNYKVYKTQDVNAFACADGSVRVYSGLMDIMDDNELLAVIGHEIGHVANHHSKAATKRAYEEQALAQGASAVSSKAASNIAKLSNNQLAQIGKALVDSKYTRTQETEADLYGYNFLKSNGYNVNAQEASFNVLGAMSQGQQGDLLSIFLSSHPDPATRAKDAKARAVKDGLYSPYTQQPISNAVPVAKKTTTTTTKKTTTAKKTTAKKTTTTKK